MPGTADCSHACCSASPHNCCRAALLLPQLYPTSGTAVSPQYLLATHPEALARVCEELEGLGLLAGPANPAPRAVAHEDLGRLPWLTACMKVRVRAAGVQTGC